MPSAQAVARDFMDTSLGNQGALNSQGNPCVVLALTPQGAKLVMDAVKYWQEHNCSSAIELGLHLLHLVQAQVAPLMEQLPEVEDWEPFPHRVD